LIISNELDYRVPVGEGLQLFTARNGWGRFKIDFFPDEATGIETAELGVLVQKRAGLARQVFEVKFVREPRR